jgi:hypothetical protein
MESAGVLEHLGDFAIVTAKGFDWLETTHAVLESEIMIRNPERARNGRGPHH